MSTQDSSSLIGHDADRSQDQNLVATDPVVDQAAEQSSVVEKAIIDQLSVRIGVDRFELWFSNKDSICFDLNSDGNCSSQRILISAESSFALQRIQHTFGMDVRKVVDRICGPQVGIAYSVVTAKESDAADSSKQRNSSLETGSGLPKSQTEHSNAHPTEHSQLPIQQSLTISSAGAPNQLQRSANSAKRRFRNLKSFSFGEENRLAEASVQQLFQQPGQFSPFFVFGPSGSGKSHLVEAIVNDFRRRLKLKRCVFLTAEQFTSLFVNSLRGGSGLPMFRRKYRDLDLLAIDDVQFLAGKRATLNEFQYTIDNLTRIGKQVVVSSDRPPLELDSLGGDLCARLTAGLTCPLRYPGFDSRLKIVRQMCAERNLKFSAPVLELICERMTRDVRRLSGAVNRLHAIASATGMEITREIAQTELCDLFSVGSGNSTTMVSIEQAVCEFCGIKPSELKSSSRRKQISTARMLAMYLSREYTSSAFSEIGDYFGGRSHSTVIAAQRKVSGWIESNKGVALSNSTYPAKEVISRIESNLRIG